MSQLMRSGVLRFATLSFVLAFPLPLKAETPAPSGDIQHLMLQMEQQQKLIEEMRQTLTAQQAQLAAQEKDLNESKTRLNALATLSSSEMATTRGAGPAKKSADKRPIATNTGTPSGTSIAAPEQKEEESARPEIAVLPDAGGVLTPKGTLVYENSLEYTNTSNNVFSFNGVQVAQSVLVGVLNAASSRQETVMDSSRFRLGLTNRLEADVRVPYVHSHSATSTTDTTTNTTTRTSIDGSGLGDIDAGLAYQFNSGRNGWPFLVGNLRYKANNGNGPYDVPVDSNNVITEMPTGTGFNAVQGSVTAIKVSDPAVLFANLGYIYNVPETVNKNFNNTRITDVSGGDNVNASLGMGFSINPDMSFTLGYKHSYVFPVVQESQNLTTSVVSKSRTDTLQVGSMLFGVSYALSPVVNLNFNTEVGATSDAPDVHLMFRVPIRLGQLF